MKNHVSSFPCMIWKGYKQKDGYGVFKQQLGKTILIHRFSYEKFVGSIPYGMLVLHNCDNPPCFEPTHLYLGTHDDNQEEKASKGRAWRPTGSSNGRAILTSDDVISIKEALSDPYRDASLNEIAEFFGVSVYAISDIKRGKNWKIVPEV
jgi:HNH endonuclease